MKRKAAFAEEEDPITGEAILGTETSASFSLSPEQDRERRRKWRKSASDFVMTDSDSVYLGPMLNMIKQAKEHDDLVTIVGGEYEDHEEVWKECQNVGSKFRYFSPKDTVINGENKTYVSREILASKEGGDLENETPYLIIAQRKHAVGGKIALHAHKLVFRGRVDVDRPYIFPKLGDEIPGVGCPDLHCTFRGVRDWHTVVKKANFAGFDRNVDIHVTADDVRKGKKIAYDITENKVVDSGVRPTLGVLISCLDLKYVLNGFKEEASKTYMSPPSKKTKLGDEEAKGGKVSETIGLKLIRMGPEVAEHGLRADLNINLVLKC